MKRIFPVQPSRTDPNPLVLYHGQCPDGFAAALSAWLYFEGRGEYIPCSYGRAPPDVTGRAVYILDFSFSMETMQRLASQAVKLVMLDHHDSAERALRNFQCDCGMVHFDQTKSGARLAWEFFHPEKPVPRLVRRVEDRDLELNQIPMGAAYLAALDTEPYDFVRWKAVLEMDDDETRQYLDKGIPMDIKVNSLAEGMAHGAQPIMLCGQLGAMVNASFVFHGPVASRLARDHLFGLAWCMQGPHTVKVGLRALRGGFDCSQLALQMGGGGHPFSSGFKIHVSRLPELLAGTLNPESGA